MPPTQIPEQGITLTPLIAAALTIMVVIITLLYLAAPKSTEDQPKGWFADFRKSLGIDKVHAIVAATGLLIWIAFFGVLVIGWFWIIHEVVQTATPASDDQETTLRWTLLTLTALTGAIGAVIALPFTLIKRLHSARQTDATEEGLITDRINTAVLGLGTEKTVKRPVCDAKGDPIIKSGTAVTEEITAPNIEVRVGAILALERLAKNNLGFHVQIMQMLCTYIRANAPANDAAPVPDFPLKAEEEDGPLGDGWHVRVMAWRKDLAQALAPPREDITTAMQVIGRRTARQRQIEAEWGKGGKGDAFPFDIPCPEPPQPPEDFAAYEKRLRAWKDRLSAYKGYLLDLRHTNLQELDMSGLNFAGARFDAAQMQGASFNDAQMQGASLDWAQMQGASLDGAQMQGAWLNGAQMQVAWLNGAQTQGASLDGVQMQGASLDGAQMQGARLGWVQMDATTSLLAATLRGAAVRKVDLTNVPISSDQLQSLFGDASVTLPGGKGPKDDGWPGHWPKEELDWGDFVEKWRAWQKNPPADPSKTP